MEPAQPEQSDKKKFLTLLTLSVILIGGVLYASYSNKYTENNTAEVSTPPPRELTEAEKLSNTQREEIDKIRQNLLQPTTTIQTQIKDIDRARTQISKQNTPTTQQLQQLDTLRSATIIK